MISFDAKDIILVTGASSGLGAESAVLLNSLGATVIGAGRNMDRLAAVRENCADPQRFIAIEKDLARDLDSLPAWLKNLRERHGRLRGLLCCAGICEHLPIRMQDAESMRRLFDINVFAMYQVARGFLDKRNNIGEGSSAVLLASTGALINNSSISAYASSKGAVIGMMRSLACEMLTQRARVNSISPAVILTPMTEGWYSCARLNDEYPFGTGMPRDVAQLAAFLLSSASRWITGQNIVVDGGRGLL